MKEQKISAIKEGTVIDHIPANRIFKVVEILNLRGHEEIISIASNLKSKKMDKKAIVKVGGKELTQEEYNKISITAPEATISIIKDYKVKKKHKVNVPEEFVDIIKCSNPKCITQVEKTVTKFHVENIKPLKVRCNHCERSMSSPNIELLYH